MVKYSYILNCQGKNLKEELHMGALKQKKNFVRNDKFCTEGLLLIVSILLALCIALDAYDSGINEAFITNYIPWFIPIGILFVFIHFCWLEDFHYSVEVKKNSILIIISQDEIFFINRPFGIKKKDYRWIILDDNLSKIKIAYNNDLLKYLESIRN